MVSISPVHNHKATYDAGEVAGGDVAPEVGHRTEEYGAIPEMEFCAGEASVEDVEDGRS